MRLTETALQEFRVMLREDYPETDFSADEVRKLAEQTLNVVQAVYRRIPMDGETVGSGNDDTPLSEHK